ncbi:MAG: DUF1330 domain-containing protein [Gammaproteobacteria bacterium]|nr:DUF1330 domain-containing protein [Gammaproteobacteria bacterium]
MAGYWVVRGSEIRDQQALQEYGKLWIGIAERFGAEVIAGKGAIDTREGAAYPRQLIIRFDSYQRAVNCYEDPEYQRAMAFALKAYYERELSILEG